jgi:hypothetical protein
VKKICFKSLSAGCFYTFLNHIFNNRVNIFKTGTVDSEMHLKLSVG